MDDYFRSDGDYIYSNVPYMEFYIPNYYFEGTNPFAEERGTILSTLGLFNVGIIENDSLKEMKTFNVPSRIELFVYNSENRNVLLPGSDQPVMCKVLSYTNGAKVFPSGVIENSENATMFLKLVTMGKIPATVPYDSSLEIWHKNQELNSVSFGVPSMVLEIVLSAAYRYKYDTSKKFGVVAGKDLNVSMHDYIMVSIREICKVTSTYTALTFEDMDSMITASLNRVRNGTDETESPVEKILKM